MRANRVRFSQEKSESELKGQVQLRDTGILVQAESAILNNQNQQAELQKANFLAHDAHFRGNAENISIDNSSGQKISLEDTGFTLCPPNDEDWRFNANKVNDNATFEEPLQFAEGVNHVLVNGIPVLLNGKHTNKYSGRFVKGPGFKSN